MLDLGVTIELVLATEGLRTAGLTDSMQTLMAIVVREDRAKKLRGVGLGAGRI
jgi:hypothetical protein